MRRQEQVRQWQRLKARWPRVRRGGISARRALVHADQHSLAGWTHAPGVREWQPYAADNIRMAEAKGEPRPDWCRDVVNRVRVRPLRRGPAAAPLRRGPDLPRVRVSELDQIPPSAPRRGVPYVPYVPLSVREASARMERWRR